MRQRRVELYRPSFWGLLVIAVLALSRPVSGSDTVRIADDRGGQISEYLRIAHEWKRANKRVIIDGNCESACTVILGVLPRGRICVTARARLGFHAAWRPGFFGQPVVNWEASQVLFDLYPRDMQDWIGRKGGLSVTLTYLEGAELAKFFQKCPAGRKIF